MRQVFVCACGSPEHQFIVEPGFEYLLFHIHLTPWSFWRRVIIGLKYIFGRDSRHTFEEMMLQQPEVTRLRGILDEFLEVT